MVVRRGRHTKTRQRVKRARLSLSKLYFVKCQNCQAPVSPHQVCSNCGYYKGRQVIDVLAKLDKKERKKKKRELAEAQKQEKPLSAEELSKK